MAKKTVAAKKTAAKKCCPCPIDVARRHLSAAKTCSEKEQAFAVFKKVAAAKVAARFVSRAEKEKLFAEMLKKDTAVALCGRAATPAAVAQAKGKAAAEVVQAVKVAEDSWTRMAQEAHRRQMVEHQPMDGLFGLGLFGL